MKQPKLPKVSVYITAVELLEIIEHSMWILRNLRQNELLIRVEGVINYHDYKKIKRKKR